MNEKITLFISESPVHVGCGQAMEAVDLPVIRERATSYPYIPGSSVKGVMRDDFRKRTPKHGPEEGGHKEQECRLFGDQDRAGELLIGDLNLLFFPVRCFETAWVWITSPDLLRRFTDVEKRLGTSIEDQPSVTLADGEMLAMNRKTQLHLEEFCFEQGNAQPDTALRLCENLEPYVAGLENRLIIVNDKMLQFFVKNATEVITRIAIDEKTGIVRNGALFYEECLPRDTVFYNTVARLNDHQLPKYLRLGGDRSIGRGIFRLNTLD